jgi:uncharacterized protein (DUF305 family)
MRILVAIAVLVLATVPLAIGASSVPAPNPTLSRLSGLSGHAFDVAFIQELIPVDDEAIEMAMTATLYADHSELLRWNQDFVERTNGQVRKMLAWLQEMGAQPRERKSGVATASVKKIRALRGAALERMYLPLLASQIDQETALARLAAQKASKPALREFAHDVLKVEGRESGMLRGWLKKWY